MTNIKEEYKLNFFNFARGEKITINIQLSLDKINKLLEVFQTYSSSK